MPVVIALAVLAVLFAALAVVFWRFYLTLDKRISAILAGRRDPTVYRYALPDELKDRFPEIVTPAEQDVTGAWAAEQARLGVEVSDEEMDEQRRMWAAEGVA